jgi:hypothetical protein
MPLGPQPRNADGSIEHPYSALRLRRILAAVGIVLFAALAGALFALGQDWLAGICVIAAVAGLIDLWIIQVRIGRHRRS